MKPRLCEEPIPQVEKRQPAYKLRAPIEDEVQVEEILGQMENQKIELTQGQLLGISTAGFRRKFVEKIIPRRVPLDVNTMKILALDYDEEDWIVDEGIAELAEEDTKEEFMRMDDLPVATYLVLPEERHDMKAGTIIMEDPYELYVASLQPGEKRGLFPMFKSGFLTGSADKVSRRRDDLKRPSCNPDMVHTVIVQTSI